MFDDPEKRQRAKELLRPLHEAMTILAPISQEQKEMSQAKLNSSCKLFPGSFFSTVAVVRDQASHCHFDIADDTTGTGMVRLYLCVYVYIMCIFWPMLFIFTAFDLVARGLALTEQTSKCTSTPTPRYCGFRSSTSRRTRRRVMRGRATGSS